MRQPLELFLANQAREALDSIPVGVQSIKRLPREWSHGPGVFVALAHGEGEAKETFWRFYPRSPGGWGSAVMDDVEVFRAIVCPMAEPRSSLADDDQVRDEVVLVDWDLLRQCAQEVASALTLRRSTAAITRGASEGSSKVRAQLLSLAGDLDLDHLYPLLDRLEQVRVEDFDARPGYRPFRDRLRLAQLSDSLPERRQLLIDLAERGIGLFGDPEPDDVVEVTEVSPDELRLIAWEVLVEAPTRREPVTDQRQFPVL
jgi:hypothetical protein